MIRWVPIEEPQDLRGERGMLKKDFFFLIFFFNK